MESAMITLFILPCIILSGLVVRTHAHGRLIEPPSRSSMWRYGFNTPINYDDNQLFCGGFDVQWNQNGGRCGVCGDPYNGARENEAGGKYATGTLSRHYQEGETITVTVDVTSNHGGFFEFRMCPNNNPARSATEECLNQHLLAQPSGQTKWQLPTGTRQYSVQLVLPRGLTCTQCVLQWKWTTASSWGCDTSGQCCKGCGKQETFMGCADVAVSGSGSIGSGLTQYSPNNVVNPQTNNNNNNNNIGANPGSGSMFLPIGSAAHVGMGVATAVTCQATPTFKIRYAYADKWCQAQCPTGNCPLNYCNDGCRQIYGGK